MKRDATEYNKDLSSLGGKIYTLRTQKNIGQKEFAKFLHVSVSTISNYENNIHEPDFPTLIKIADYFEVSIDYLLNRTSFHYPISYLEKYMLDNYTYSALLNTAIQLSATGRSDLIKYLDMLSMRDNSGQSSLTSPKNN